MSHAAAHTPTSEGSKFALAGTIALWTLQVAVAAFFIMGGITKIIGAPEMVGLFEAIGVGQWFRYATGILEIAGAVLLLIPRLAAVGALVIAAVMLGAVLTHFFVIGGSATMALVFLATSSIIAVARRDQLARVAERIGSRRSHVS